ncbi:MAG: PaaI family thioesterase [Gammaproteobacteria bacterium]|nr:PaaI family thioesterase [Gammaproteobacteria bacterium]
MADQQPRISETQFEEISRQRVPFIGQLGVVVDELGYGSVNLRIPFQDDFLRPGGTIAGPVMMGLADLAMYGVVLSMIGPVELAVTTSLNINFLRRPRPGDVLAHARILKLGRRLAVGEVTLYRDGDEDPVAHVTSTYSIPPDRSSP